MSRFLRNKKVWLIATGFLLCAALIYMQEYIFALVLVALMGYYIINYLMVRQCLLPLADLSSMRPIRQIDNLIIGDVCSRSYLQKHYDLNHSLVITAPGRSLSMSSLILQHVASRLDGEQVCIIVSSDDLQKVNELDIPYLSQITKKEMGVVNNETRQNYYFFIHPMALFMYLRGLMMKPKKIKSESNELIDYCRRKNFELTVLKY